MKKTKLLAVAGLAALFLSGLVGPAWADQGDMQIHFGVVSSMPSDDLTVGTQTTEFDDAFGFQAGFEYLFRDSIGVEPGLTFANFDIEITEPGFPDVDYGEIDLVALTTTVNFHFLPDRKVDVFVGPTLGYAFWGDIEVAPTSGPTDFGTDDEFIYGVSAGLDVPFGESRWGFAAALRLLLAEVSVEGSATEIGVDPLHLEVGLSYSF